MASLPSNLGLTNIADAASIVASDHRNNYSAIQAAVNSLLTTFGAGASGQVLTGNGTTLAWAYPQGYQWDRATRTTDYTVTVSNTAILTGSSITYDGAEVKIEVFLPRLTTNSNTVAWQILEDATVIAQGSISNGGQPTKIEILRTPSGGAHTMSFKVATDASTATMNAGAGGAAVYPQAFLRVTKV